MLLTDKHIYFNIILMGIVLYSPGRGETPADYCCGLIETVAEQRGDVFRVLGYDWKNGTIDDWAAAAECACAEYDPTDTQVVGMSLGSMAAVVAVSRMVVQPRRLVLLSLSARFHEDLPNLPADQTDSFTDVQLKAFGRHRFNHIAPRITCPTLLVVGELEYRQYPTLAVRVEKAQELIPNAQLVVAEGAGHDLRSPGYRDVLKKVI